MGSIIVLVLGCFSAGLISIGFLYLVARYFERRTSSDRLRAQAYERTPWGDVVQLRDEMRARTARTSPGEGAVKAARAGEPSHNSREGF